MTRIPAELELAEVLRKMLPADVNMSATDRSLEHGPKAFNGIGVNLATRIFVHGVVHSLVPVAQSADADIAAPLNGTDGRTLLDVGEDVRMQDLTAGPGNDARHNVAIALGHAEDHRLIERLLASAELASAADERFVDFDVPAKRRIAVDNRHMLAEFMAHAPSRFIRHAQLALKFLRRHAMPGRGEQIHGIEPLLERRPGPLEGGSFHRADLIAAPLAAINRTFVQAVKLAVLATLGAIKSLAIADLHKMVQAGVVGWKSLKELLNRWGFGHLSSLPPLQYGV